MDKVKITARKSTGGAGPRITSTYSSNSNHSEVAEMSETVRSSSPVQAQRSSSTNNHLKRDAAKAFQAIKPSPDVSPMELQIRELELMEEQCDSLEKLVEIAAERRDIEREILEIKKRKLALLEKNMKK